MPTYGTLTTNTDTALVFVQGPFVFKAAGTWGGGTIAVKLKCGDGTYRSLVTSASITSDATGEVLFDLPSGPNRVIKATLSGSTGATIYYEFVGDVSSAPNET